MAGQYETKKLEELKEIKKLQGSEKPWNYGINQSNWRDKKNQINLRS